MFCFVDYRITDEEIFNLKSLNITPIKLPKCDTLYSAIDGHVDIQMALLSKTPIFHKDIPLDFLLDLRRKNISYTLSLESLENKYPKDIILNALITEDFILHNLAFTDKTLLKLCSSKKKINTKQGYTNCSTLQVARNAFITSDVSISRILKENNCDVLLVSPRGIELPPLEYGFIGGTGGLISPTKMVFFGHLDFYPCGELIKEFLHKYNVEPIYLKKGPLTDRGGIFSI